MAEIRIQDKPLAVSITGDMVCAIEEGIGGITERAYLQDIADLSAPDFGRIVNRVRIHPLTNDSNNTTTDQETGIVATIEPLDPDNTLEIKVILLSKIVNRDSISASFIVGNASLYRSTQSPATLVSSSVGRNLYPFTTTSWAGFYQSVTLNHTELAGSNDLHRYVVRFRSSTPGIYHEINNGIYASTYITIEERTPA